MTFGFDSLREPGCVSRAVAVKWIAVEPICDCAILAVGGAMPPGSSVSPFVTMVSALTHGSAVDFVMTIDNTDTSCWPSLFSVADSTVG